MTDVDVRRLGLILAIQAEVEGMKARNDQRKHCRSVMAYSMEEFQEKAEELRNIVYCHEEQL